jgi:hypothetical protein
VPVATPAPDVIAYPDLLELRESWGDLLVALGPGTPLPWNEIPLTEAEQARRAEAAARCPDCFSPLAERPEPDERYEDLPRARYCPTCDIQPASGKAPARIAGPSEAPLRLDVVDAVAHVTTGLLALEDAVRVALGLPARCDRCTHEAGEHWRHGAAGGCAGCPTCPGYVRRQAHGSPAVTAYRAGQHRIDCGACTTRPAPHERTGQLRWLHQDGCPEAARPWRREFTAAHRERIDRASGDGSVHWAACWLEDLAPEIAACGSDLAQLVAVEARRLLGAVRRALHLLEPRQHLKAPCFCCGQRTLFAYLDMPVPRALDGRVAVYSSGSSGSDEENASGGLTAIVVCMNDGCEPTEAQCGTWWRGRPVWHRDEFEWLSDRLTEAAAAIPEQRRALTDRTYGAAQVAS